MIKKAALYAAICALVFSLFVSCAGEQVPPVSSDSTSSEITSSEQEESSDKQEAWGDPDNKAPLIRPSFLSTDAKGDVFYVDAEGGIYKQLVASKGLSKLYSSSGYDFISVQYISENLICAGYKNEAQASGYIIFNLKEKTVTNAVTSPEFKGKNIYSLICYKNSVYFLANPDRYGRYTLYMQNKAGTSTIASGVNEFVLFKNKIFYNVGGYIFSANADGSDTQMLTEVVTHDFVGFTLTNDSLFYMSTENVYRMPIASTGYTKYEEQVKVYTSASSKDHTFFCGTNGGIYAYCHISDELVKVSDYTAEEIAVSSDYLYLKPAKPEDYPEVDEKYVIQNSIYRFNISELIASIDQPQNDSSSLSSSLSDTELTSSSPADVEVEPLVPEKFGK